MNDEQKIKVIAAEMEKQAVDRGLVDYFSIGAEPAQFFAHYLTQAYNLACANPKN